MLIFVTIKDFPFLNNPFTTGDGDLPDDNPPPANNPNPADSDNIEDNRTWRSYDADRIAPTFLAWAIMDIFIAIPGFVILPVSAGYYILVVIPYALLNLALNNRI